MDDAIEAVNATSDEVHKLEKTYRDSRTEERAARLDLLSKAAIRLAATLETLSKIREVV